MACAWNVLAWRLCLTAVLAACAFPGQAQTLVVGRAAVDSTLADHAAAVMSEAARRSGLQLEFRRLPLVRSIELANEGAIDADLIRTREFGRAYSHLIALDTPIAHFDVAAYGASPDIAKRTRDDFRHLRIGAARGLALAQAARDLPVVEVATDGTLPEMLRDGRFDVAIVSYVYGETWRNRFGGIYRWPVCWSSDPLVFHLNRKHAPLASRLNAALEQMQNEGLIARMYLDALRGSGVAPLECRVEGAAANPARGTPHKR